MRKIVVYVITSLDGAVDDPNRLFPADVDPDQPQPPTFDDELIERENALIARQDAVLLGRHMHDAWSHYWPTSAVQPFADVVRELKSLPGNDIGVHGSIELAQSLIAGGLVDELHLAVAPVVDPEGRRLFDRATDLQRLTLGSATPTPTGALWLVYRPG